MPVEPTLEQIELAMNQLARKYLETHDPLILDEMAALQKQREQVLEELKGK
jgi:hypothetical protein